MGENLKPIARKWSCKNNKYGAKIFNMLYTISLVEKLSPNIEYNAMRIFAVNIKN